MHIPTHHAQPLSPIISDARGVTFREDRPPRDEREVTQLASSFSSNAIERAMAKAFGIGDPGPRRDDGTGPAYHRPFEDLYREGPSPAPVEYRGSDGNANGSVRRRPGAPQPRTGSARFFDDDDDDGFIAEDNDDEYNVVDEVTGAGPLPVRRAHGGGGSGGGYSGGSGGQQRRGEVERDRAREHAQSPRGSRRAGISNESVRPHGAEDHDNDALYANVIRDYGGTSSRERGFER
jgi:hypothetical protein